MPSDVDGVVYADTSSIRVLRVHHNSRLHKENESKRFTARPDSTAPIAIIDHQVFDWRKVTTC